ncbi:MAG: hypothetical protein Q8M17_13770 [Actinomycetota bacterium]|nr:hypothetical protein [Actinomycetota bacterium]
MTADLHPPGRRRLRSAVRDDGYETWTIAVEQYDVLRSFIVATLEDLDSGDGVLLKHLIEVAELELAEHPSFPCGRFTNWIRFVKVDLECEGVVERVDSKSPQRLRVVAAP